MTAPGYPPPYGAPQGFPAPTYPAPAPSDGPRDAVFSALLLLPFAVFVVLRALSLIAHPLAHLPGNAWVLGWNVMIDIYFVCLVLARSRTSGRRIGAGLVALGAAVLDFTVMLWIVTLEFWPASSGDLVAEWVPKIIDVVIIVAAVAAWGIARRRHPLWTLGLIPTLIFALLATQIDFNLYESMPHFAAALMTNAIWFAAPILGGLCCWGCDALGSGMRRGVNRTPQ